MLSKCFCDIKYILCVSKLFSTTVAIFKKYNIQIWAIDCTKLDQHLEYTLCIQKLLGFFTIYNTVPICNQYLVNIPE